MSNALIAFCVIYMFSIPLTQQNKRKYQLITLITLIPIYGITSIGF